MLSYKVKGVEGSINRYGGNSNDMELWFAFEKRRKLNNAGASFLNKAAQIKSSGNKL